MLNQKEIIEHIREKGYLAWVMSTRKGGYVGIRPDILAGADLAGCNFAGCNLDRMNLEGCRLVSANLRGATLTTTNLRGADLCYADLCGADLSYADLVKVDLSYANLVKVDLSYANLNSVRARYTNFSGSDLTGATMIDGNFFESDFTGAEFDGTEAASAKFTRCTLANTIIDEDSSFGAALFGGITGAIAFGPAVVGLGGWCWAIKPNGQPLILVTGCESWGSFDEALDYVRQPGGPPEYKDYEDSANLAMEAEAWLKSAKVYFNHMGVYGV